MRKVPKRGLTSQIGLQKGSKPDGPGPEGPVHKSPVLPSPARAGRVRTLPQNGIGSSSISSMRPMRTAMTRIAS